MPVLYLSHDTIVTSSGECRNFGKNTTKDLYEMLTQDFDVRIYRVKSFQTFTCLEKEVVTIISEFPSSVFLINVSSETKLNVSNITSLSIKAERISFSNFFVTAKKYFDSNST